MTNKKITDFTTGPALTGNEFFPIAIGDKNYKYDLNFISTWFSGKPTAYNFGALADDPAVSPFDGGPIPLGAQYYNTTLNAIRAFGDGGWFTPNLDAAIFALSTGAQLVGTPEGTVQDALDGRVKTLQNYTALLAYPGTVPIQITTMGIAGPFIYNASAPNTTDGGTRFAHASGTGAWERRDDGPILPEWFGANGISDSTLALRATMAAIPVNGGVRFSGQYKSNGVIVMDKSNVRIIFDGCTFLMGDTGDDATTVNGAVGKVGLHFKEADNIQVTGSAQFIGQGTIGVTSLLGVMFDHCDDVSCPAFMRFETMAIGRFLTSCARGTWGDAYGRDMNGLQPFETPPTDNAGSVEVVSGCSWGTFGDVVGHQNEKPVRYMSVASSTPNNIFCKFGATSCQAVSVSPTTAHALALRSAINCSFGPVIASGGSLGVLITQYNTDAAWSVDGNVIECVVGDSADTLASLDAMVAQETTSPNPIGVNTILALDAGCSGERGVSVLSGTLNIGKARIKGPTNRAIVVAADSGVAKLNIDHLQLDGPGGTASFASVGNGGVFVAGTVDVTSGPADASGITAIVRYDPAFGVGSLQGVDIGLIRYRRNGSAGNFLYAYMDLAYGFGSARIGSVDSSDLTAHMRFSSDEFSTVMAGVGSTAIPTSGSYTVGKTLWNTATTAGGTPGWSCTTAGTPGTWKAMAALAA